MKSRRVARALEVTEWADRPMRWAVRLALAPAPFRTLRKLPLMALYRVIDFQVLLLKK